MMFNFKILNTTSSKVIFIFFVLLSNIFGQAEIKKNFTLGIYSEIFEDVNIRDVKASLTVWGKILVGEIPNVDNLKIVMYENVESIIEDSWKNEIDIMYINSLTYVEHEDKINLNPVVSTKSNLKDFYTLNFLTKKGKSATDFTELKNSTILVQGGKYKRLAELWLDFLMLENGIKDKEKFFKKIEIVEKPMQAVLPLIMGKADYSIVNSVMLESLSELNPQVSNSLKSIYISPPFNNDLLCINKELSEAETELVTSIALNFNTMPKNEQIFKIFKTVGAGKFKQSDLDGIRSLLNNYNRNLALTNGDI